MDGKAKRLTHKLNDAELAQRLAEAGLDTPRKIKAAKDEDIADISGIGPSGADRVRATFPRG
ncbi:MAG: helix-hairpin-helix domain-containing protein [Phycisphaerales bacterium]|jgi:predicted flap endonuclease-1-like 5' DNA nuclease